MTTNELQELISCSGVLGFFLLVGMFLRAKVPLFRKLLLPASVLGGTVCLLLGPQVLGEHAILPIPESYISDWSLLSGILVLPIFAAAPLGSGMDKKSGGLSDFKKTLPIAMGAGGLFATAAFAQGALGYAFNIIVTKFFPAVNIYPNFGYEMASGFTGGHSAAVALGSMLQGYGVENWETVQGVGIAFATIGLVGGMISGIYFINRASKKGECRVLNADQGISSTMACGFTKNISEQESMGRETTHSSSIETISVHIGIILIDCALSYWLLSKAKEYHIPGLSALPVWVYGLWLMYGINFLLRKLNLSWLIDSRVKARVTGAITDFAIIAAIASVPINVVMTYIVPILIVSVLGFVLTYLLTFPLSKYVFGKNYPFERSVICWGTNTGVMVNGIALLKICDPDFESPVMNDFSLGFALYSLGNIFAAPLIYSLAGLGTPSANFMFHTAMALAWFVIGLVGRILLKKAVPENA